MSVPNTTLGLISIQDNRRSGQFLSSDHCIFIMYREMSPCSIHMCHEHLLRNSELEPLPASWLDSTLSQRREQSMTEAVMVGFLEEET